MPGFQVEPAMVPRAVLTVALSFGVLIHCGHPGLGEGEARDWHSMKTLEAPPRPGFSITHTKLCECMTCSPERCCSGEEEGAASSGACDSYDFTRAGCGLTVESCRTRCSKHVWRVGLHESCSNLPEACCR